MVVPIPILHINTCMTLTASKSTTTMANSLSEVNTTQLHAFAEVCSSISESLPPVTSPVVMNSLMSPTKVITTNLSAPISHMHSTTTSGLSPKNIMSMKEEIQVSDKSQSVIVESNDILFKNETTDLSQQETDSKKHIIYGLPSSAEAMEEENLSSPSDTLKSSTDDIQMLEAAQQKSLTRIQVLSEITISDLLLLCDLFYLPFEHGEKGLYLLNEFQWLKSNAYVLVANKGKLGSEEIQEWNCRASAFQNLCLAIQKLTKKIVFCKNRELCYDLYTYVWEVSSITSLLSAFVQWLGLSKFPLNIQTYTQGSYTYFSKGWNEAFTSGNNEPWVYN